MNSVIFEIDDNSLHGIVSFGKFVDGMRAMGGIAVLPCIGMYKGELNYSFVTERGHYETLRKKFRFMDKQDSVICVSDFFKGRVYAELCSATDLQLIEKLGELKVSREMPNTDGWTYRPDLGLYWSTE